MTEVKKPGTRRAEGAGLIYESDRPGSQVLVWGNVQSPFVPCPRYGGCPDVVELADDLAGRTHTPPDTPKDELNKPLAELLSMGKIITSQWEGRRELMDFNKLIEDIIAKKGQVTDPAHKAKIQESLNKLIDKSQPHLLNDPSPPSLNGYKEKFETFDQVGKLIANADKIGVQGSDLSYSRLNTHSGAFALNTLQAGLQYRDALLLQLQTRPAGSNFSRDLEDFRKLTDRLGELAPERKREFELYRDQSLQSLGQSTPAPRVPGM